MPLELTKDMLEDSGRYLDGALGGLGKTDEGGEPKPPATPPVKPDEGGETKPPATPPAKPEDGGTPEVDPLLVPEGEPKPDAGDSKPKDEAKPDSLDSIQLPPHARPNTAEAFTKVKELARTQLAERDTRLADLERQLKEANEKVQAAGRPDPKILEELQSLRDFKAGLQLQVDPNFEAKYVKPLQSLDEQIYGVLKADKATDADIEQLREYGGIDGVDFEEILGQLKPENRRRVEALLLRREQVKLDKEAAVGSGKEKLESFLKETRAQQEAEGKRKIETLGSKYREFVGQIPTLKLRVAPENATPEQKKVVEDANNKIQEAIRNTEQLAKEDDPEVRAEIAAVAAVSQVLRLEKTGLQTLLKQANQTIADLKKQLGVLKSATRAGGGTTEVLTPSQVPPAKELPIGTSAMAAFEQFEASLKAKEV